MTQLPKRSGSKSTRNKLVQFKNLRKQEGLKRGHKFSYDKHRCSKAVKMGIMHNTKEK
jgi:hypothetical protein